MSQRTTANAVRRAACRITSPHPQIGAIEFGNEAIPCTVRNLSPHGACIEVNSPLWFPDGFVLAVDGLRHTCRVAWKKDRRIGLRFA
ncbi:PilZ domain-containing protein [Bradyrhizobium oropedii]|uniref:PilZ domain-containing protein n=1 Tax=Bradyrhizobium oropedii TaxID=1571201 RepID=UPI0030845024